MKKCILLFWTVIVLILATKADALQSEKKIDNQTNAKVAYQMTKKINVGGEGGWDYLTVDSQAHRLYVSHSSKVVVIDIDSNATVGEIANTNGVHGVAIANDLGRGFTSNGKDSTVSIFELKTLKVLGEVKTGTNPDAIAYDPNSHYVFAFNHTSNNTTVIDGNNGKVITTIELGGSPEFAVIDEKGKLFVNLEDKSEVAVLDISKLKIIARWSLNPGEEPTGLAIDKNNARLFIGCGNQLMVVMDSNNGDIISKLPIGKGVDAVAFDPDSKIVFSSNGEGTLTIIHQDSANKYSIVDNVKTQVGARTMALDPTTHKVFLPTAEFGEAPAPTQQQPHPRRPIVSGSFTVLVFSK